MKVPDESDYSNYSLIGHSGPWWSKELLTAEEDTVKEYWPDTSQKDQIECI